MPGGYTYRARGRSRFRECLPRVVSARLAFPSPEFASKPDEVTSKFARVRSAPILACPHIVALTASEPDRTSASHIKRIFLSDFVFLTKQHDYKGNEATNAALAITTHRKGAGDNARTGFAHASR